MYAMTQRPKWLTKVALAIEEITPDIATQMLLHNHHNRNLKERAIAQYIRDMDAGRWELNGESIIIAESGELMDGQNRLHAVVRSGVTIWSVVVRGIPDNLFKSVGRATKRTISDGLVIGGEAQGALLASVASHIWRYEEFPDRFASSYVPTPSEIDDLLAKQPGIRDSIVFTSRNKVSGLVQSRAGALYYLFSQIDKDDADDFFSALSTGANLGPENPILRLREWLVNNLANKRRVVGGEVFAVVIKAWNFYRDGREVGRSGLRWRSQGPAAEPFPQPY